MKKAGKKGIALVLALAMMIPGVILGNTGSGQVQAQSGEPAAAAEVTDAKTGAFDAEGYSVGQAKNLIGKEAPKKDGYLFAGWYLNETCKKNERIQSADQISGETGDIYAKFVPEDVLSVKVQSTQGPVTGLPEEENEHNGQYAIRFVSSVESLDYDSVGFEYAAAKNGEVESWKSHTTRNVYPKIEAAVGALAYNYSPKVVDTKSEYFITMKISVAEKDLDAVYAVRAFWKTWDGTTVYGAPRFVSAAEGIANKNTDGTINLYFKAEDVEKDTVLTVDPAGTAEIVGVYDGVVTVKVTPAGGKDSLKSATKFTFKKDGGDVATVIYRNLETRYDGTEETKDTTWYDVYGNGETEFTIATSADLYGFANVVNGGNTLDGKTVYLVTDIEANRGTASEDGWTKAEKEGTEYEWTPIGRKPTGGNAFRGTFDGQGHTIRGIYINETSGTGLAVVSAAAGLFGYTVDSTIRNLRLENSYMYSSTGVLGSIIGYGEGDLINIYSNADLVFGGSSYGGSQVGGLIGRVQDGTSKGDTQKQKQEANCNITGCWFDGTIKSEGTGNSRAGGLLGYSIYGDNTISHSLFTGKIQVTGDYVGGLIADSNGTSYTTIAITDSLSAGLVVGTGTNVGAVVGRSNENNSSGTPKVGATTVNRTVCKTDQCNEKAVGSGSAGESISRDEKLLYGKGSYVYTELDFEQYWAARDKAVPAPKYFVGEGLDVSGLDISTKEELVDLVSLVNEEGINFAGKTIRLNSDIDLNEDWEAGEDAPSTVWTPIGTNSNSNSFLGTFDGQGHTIRGVYVNMSDNDFTGLFGKCGEGSIIRNLKLENSYFNSSVTNSNIRGVGSIVGYFQGARLENIYSDASVSAAGQNAGGLIGGLDAGQGNEVTVANCWFAGNVTGANLFVGGLIGLHSTGNLTMVNCMNTGMVTNTYMNKDKLSWTGGLIGAGYDATDAANKNGGKSVSLCNCVNTGAVEVKGIGAVGSVIGRSRVPLTIENVYTTDDIRNTDGERIVTTNGLTGVGSATTNSNTVTGEPVKVDFSAAGTLDKTLAALNAKATEEGWSGWVEKDGIPALEKFLGEF